MLAYDSSADNELGYEWLLLNAVNGVSLDTVWKSLSWKEKVDITIEIADITHQLEQITFDRIAGLYVCETLCNSCQSKLRRAQPIMSQKQSDLIESTSPSLKKSPLYYGPLPRLLSNNMRKPRLHAKGRCGPFRRDTEWLEQKIRWRLDWIDFCLGLLEDNEDSENKGDNEEYLRRIGIDKVFKKNSSKYKQEYVDLLKLMSTIFETDVDEDGEQLDNSQELDSSIIDLSNDSAQIPRASYHLDHDDLHEKNIIVDPDTHRISGIIDWEVACVLPQWETSNYPLFLEGPAKMATFATAAENAEEPSSYDHNIFETECLKTIYDVTLNLRSGEPRNAVRFTDLSKLKVNFDCLIACVPSTDEHRKNLIKCELLKLSALLGNAEAVKIILDMGIIATGEKSSKNVPIPIDVEAVKNGNMELVEMFLQNTSINADDKVDQSKSEEVLYI